MKAAALALALALAAACGAGAGDGDRHEVPALGLSFVLSRGLVPASERAGRYVFRVGEPPDQRELVLEELPDAPDVDAYATKRRERFEKGPGREQKQTLRTVDGERSFSWVETRVALNTRVDTCVFVNPMTGKLTKLQLFTELEERPGVRTIPPARATGSRARSTWRP